MHRVWVCGVLLSLALSLAGCTRHAPGVCCVSTADCESIGVTDGDRPCTDGLPCLAHECSTPLAVDAPPAADCHVDMTCVAPTAVCAPDGTCVGCVDSTTCPLSAPTCDDATRMCRACGSDTDCASTVCDADAGTCVDSDAIVYASPTGSDGAACTTAAPCSIVRAFAVAGGAQSTIKLEPGSYAGGITIAGKTLLIDGFGATLTSGSGSVLEINDGAILRIVGLSVVGTMQDDSPIRCETLGSGARPTITLDRVSLDSQSFVILANPCALGMSRCSVTTSDADDFTFAAVNQSTITIDRSLLDGGTLLSGGATATVNVSNTVFRNAGTSGAFVTQGGTISVHYSTIVNSQVQCDTGTPTCAGGSASGVCIDNSVFLNARSGAPADTISGGTSCVANYTIVFPQSTSLPGANNKLGIDPALTNPATGDFHLQLGSPAIDAADPTMAGSADFDGTSRPQGPRSDMGAFELKQ